MKTDATNNAQEPQQGATKPSNLDAMEKEAVFLAVLKWYESHDHNADGVEGVETAPARDFLFYTVQRWLDGWEDRMNLYIYPPISLRMEDEKDPLVYVRSVSDLQGVLRRLREALKFYAEAAHYEDMNTSCDDPNCCGGPYPEYKVVNEGGTKARKALEKTK